ncbi:prolipoprotein diacylglyceryl transferase [bacterium BMS3Bbin04]|nr:prolipoprotein diacylglyceryl transferase [bacterium BMS3Bbin04]
MNAQTDYWVHDLSPFLIHFGGDIGLRYYGLAYVLAFLFAFWLLGRFRRVGLSPFTKPQESDVMLILVLGALIGGRLGFMLLYDFNNFIREPWSFFEVWRGGMASHGGFVGVFLAGLWITKRYKLSWWRLADLMAVMTPPGLMLGRIANFINGELWGKISYVSWAVIFPASAPVGTPISQIEPRHPSQLYEAALEGLLCTLYTQIRAWKSNVIRERPGQLGGEFLVLYALVRIISEQFREPDATLIFYLSRGTFYSVFLVIAGVVMIMHARRKHAV